MCDLARPACGRCVRFGLTCHGYAEDVKFVQVDPGSASPGSQAHRRGKHGTRKTSFELIAASPQATGLSSQPIDLMQSALRVQCNGLLWDDLAPHQSGTSLTAYGSQLPSSLSWIRSAFERSYGDNSLSTALSALSIVRRSRISQNTDLEHIAARLHVSAIQQVRKRLTGKHSYQDDSLLATIMLLASYEIFEGSAEGQRGVAWVSHVRGASQMIALRGAQGTNSLFAAQLQHAARYNELVDAIGNRRELSETPLDFLSYSKLDQKANKEVELYKVLSRLPGLLAATEALPKVLPPAMLESRMASLVTEYQTFKARLDSWYNDIQAQYEGPLYWLEPSALYAQLPESSFERIFPQCIQFFDLSLAHILPFYWTAQLLLKSVLFTSCQILRKGDVNMDLVNTFATEVDMVDSKVCHDLVYKIAQSVEYLTQRVTPDVYPLASFRRLKSSRNKVAISTSEILITLDICRAIDRLVLNLETAETDYTAAQIPQQQTRTEAMWALVNPYASFLGVMWWEPWYCYDDWEGGNGTLCRRIVGEVPTDTLRTWGQVGWEWGGLEAG
ncbi:hypothetical protein MMC17_007243 [Xylographa soralifera]|nr:hypothetical protein [Xylographa soralifera]